VSPLSRRSGAPRSYGRASAKAGSLAYPGRTEASLCRGAVRSASKRGLVGARSVGVGPGVAWSKSPLSGCCRRHAGHRYGSLLTSAGATPS